MLSWRPGDGQNEEKEGKGREEEMEVMCGMRGLGCVGMGGRWVRFPRFLPLGWAWS